MNKIYQRGLSALLLSVFLLISAVSYALPFTIVPATTLPTQISAGQTLTASYTITNNTLRTLPSSFVKYLPPNVRQVTVVLSPGTCATTFNLAAGASCRLSLAITGPVNAADPNPHNHLFVCTSNVPACAGTNYPLNVALVSGPALTSIAISPLNQNISNGGSQQFTAIGTYSDGSTQNLTTSVTWASLNTAIATIGASTGLASGVSTGSTTITATSGSLSASTALTVRPAIAYITNAGNNTVSICGVNANGTLSACSAKNDATFNRPKGVTLNSNYTYAYIANQFGNSVSICPVNADGSLAVCTSSTASGTLTLPQGITTNPAGTFLYVTNQGSTTVTICPLLAGGATLGVCTTSSGNGTFSGAGGVVLNSTGTVAYISNVGGSTVAVCPVNGDGSFGTCSTSNLSGTASLPVGTILNSQNTYAYTTNNSNATVSVCALNGDGSFGACAASGDVSYSSVQGIGINANNTYLYVTDSGSNNVSICGLSNSGATINVCTVASDGTFSSPFSAYIH